MSANEIFALEFTKKAATKAPTERNNPATTTLSFEVQARGIMKRKKRNPEAMNSEKAVHTAEGLMGKLLESDCLKIPNRHRIKF